MDGFWKAVAAVLIGTILGLAVAKKDKELAFLLTVAVCCMVGTRAVLYMEPVVNLVQELETLGKLKDGMIGILLRASGIALVTEIAAMTCADAGNAAMGKMLQIMGNAVMLYLSVPVVQAFMDLLQEILYQL